MSRCPSLQPIRWWIGPIYVVARWLVLDGRGEVVLAGTTAPGTNGTIVLPLDGRLRPGPYTAEAETLVGGKSVNPEIARFPCRVQ